jgi:hypothetical protein
MNDHRERQRETERDRETDKYTVDRCTERQRSWCERESVLPMNDRFEKSELKKDL